jgi:hypothetical protein
MVDTLKQTDGALFGIAVLAGILALPVVFILGSTWAADHLLSPLIAIGWLAVALDILILMPLSIFKRLRCFTGSVIFVRVWLGHLVARVRPDLLSLGLRRSHHRPPIFWRRCRPNGTTSNNVQGSLGSVLHATRAGDYYLRIARHRFFNCLLRLTPATVLSAML